MRRKGFTLIELLVVIAIIALLLSVMVPSLRIAKEYAAAAVCLTNQKNLCLAWTMYAEDNETYLVGGSTYYGSNNGTPYRWVEPPLNRDTDNPEVTGTASVISLETRINGIRAGRLFPYTQDHELYHCPADRTFVKEPDPAYAAYRSYAISGLMNGEHFATRDGLYGKITGEWVVAGGGRKLRVATKMGQINNPGSKLVFMEEDVLAKDPRQQWNAGGFVLMYGNKPNADPDSWWDWPADFHNDSSTIGYADGHAERVRWQDPYTLKLIKEGRSTGTPIKQPGNEDLYLLIRGYFPMP